MSQMSMWCHTYPHVTLSLNYTDKSRYPKFSRTNPSNGLLARAVMGVGKHFGWSRANVVLADYHDATSWVSELESAASTPGSALFSAAIGLLCRDIRLFLLQGARPPPPRGTRVTTARAEGRFCLKTKRTDKYWFLQKKMFVDSLVGKKNPCRCSLRKKNLCRFTSVQKMICLWGMAFLWRDGTLCRDIGLFFRDIGLFCRNLELWCRHIELFCREIGLCCRGIGCCSML